MIRLPTKRKNAMNIETVHSLGLAAAQKATTDFLARYGNRDACGFAWVTVNEKGSTKLGRALKALGFEKAYGGGLQLWNPSGSYTQCITALEEGARAYAEVLEANGIKAYVGSRMD
jgi:hypothetical protein